MPRKATKDSTWEEARRKAGELLKGTSDTELALKVINTIIKMKAVDLKMSEQDFGTEFGGEDD